MTASRPNRLPAGLLLAFGGVTAFAGGGALIAGEILDESSILTPDHAYLDGTLFDSYLVPGAILLIVVAGSQLGALFLLVRGRDWAPAATAAAGYVLLVWIFVQMTIIPFSGLQLVYFALALAEIGLILAGAGIVPPRGGLRTEPRQRVGARS